MTKGFIDLEYKGFYAGALIKKRRYCPKGITGELIDNNFQDNEVGNVVMIEGITQENKPLRILCMKYLYCIMKVLTSSMKLDELEGENKRIDFIDSS